MLRTSLVQLSRRLVHFRNTSYPVALRRQRLWSRQLSQSSFRRVLQIPTLGVFTCAATVALVLYHHQNPVVLLDSLESTRVVVEPETKVEFPATIRPHSGAPLTFVGAGVRTVSFLHVKVYAIAFYADISSIRVPKEASFDEKIEHIVSHSTVAVRIVPVRSTSYQHLRDAFLRSLRGRIHIARKQEDITPDQEDALEEPLAVLRSVFPSNQLSKGTPLVVYSRPSKDDTTRSLVFEGLGEVDNTWVSKEFFMAYFVGEGNSPALLQSVKEALGNSSLQ